MNDTKLKATKEEIEELGLNAIKGYFEIDLTDQPKEVLHHIHNRAKIGMQFEREMNLSKRAVEMNYLRVFRQIAEDKKEFKKYVMKAMPQYYPV